MEVRARAGKNVGKETFNPKEISALLYAFGDVPEPLPETVRVLDNIVTEFLEGVCFEASRHAQGAGRQKLKFDDFEFALRRNPQYLGKVRTMMEKRQKIKEARKMFDQDAIAAYQPGFSDVKDGAAGPSSRSGGGGGSKNKAAAATADDDMLLGDDMDADLDEELKKYVNDRAASKSVVSSSSKRGKKRKEIS
ncbi:TFIID-18kDa-domain-containing protein [Xylariomycetidae sp. FL2044]|nr:TFIID-18kDa-domain-containing protein [Xylariomycetidae sp. FL2044]